MNEWEIDLTNVKTIRQLSEEALEAAYDASPNNTFVEEMEDEFELRGYLTERQRARLWDIVNGR